MADSQPNMMTVRQIAKTGLLSEHALRIMLKAGKLPAIYIGNKALINYDKLCFLDIFESKSGCTLCFCGVENLNQVGHLLKTYSIAAVDSL